MLTYLRWSANTKVKVKTAPQQPPYGGHYGSKIRYRSTLTGTGHQPPQGTNVHGTRASIFP